MQLKSRLAVPCLLIAIAALGLAGCGEDGSGQAGSSPAPTTASHTTASPSKPTPTPTPKPKPPPKPRAAADGTNFKACADRTCEVLVKTGDTIRFAPKWEADRLTVTLIKGETFNFRSEDNEPADLTGYLIGNGEVNTADIHFEVTPLTRNRAILKISPRTD